ncbi:MAG: LPS export ABC transporter ATP-binding protein [Elusimicrobiales bacterium]|jgi:lipopolysaccharide export system ATP-binding protein|nr:LPS export ABC transporter ATP-binding protein [Elusimicrobiales bacterium]HPO95259.1 LPS export ABC transporter ATP-binding protein [Elusimicrobiales bacterium]
MNLRAQNLVKSYNKKKVVKGISLNVSLGEIVGLLGPNGAGKSTTFNMIIGFVVPEEGSVYIDSVDITRKPVYMRARLGLGYLAQEPTIFRELTVEDNLVAILERTVKDKKEIHSRVEMLLKEFNIERLKKQKAYTLSGGEKRRLEVARVMINNPKIIMLDEPFVGIDPITVGELKKIIKYLKNKNIGVLISDHNVRETLSIVDRAYLVYSGEVLVEGKAEDLISDPKAREFYLGHDFKL